MLKTEKILECIGLGDTEEESKKEPDNRALFEAEITEIFREMAVQHSDSQEFTKSAENLKTVTEAYNAYERAVTEKDKTEAEYQKIVKERWFKILDIAPRCVGIAASGALTAIVFLVEQEHPVSTRMINRANDFLIRP